MSKEVTIATREDSSSEADSDDSNYCSSSDDQVAPVHGERQTGLMCSVQDLLANMSCLDEDPYVDDHQTSVENHMQATQTSSNVRGSSTASSESGVGSTNTEGGIINLQDVVVDCSNNVKSAYVLPPCVYNREYNEYGYSDNAKDLETLSGQLHKSENYPLTINLMKTTGHSQHLKDTNVVISSLSPSSLERSVTREFDERLNGIREIDVTHDVSGLENSQCKSPCQSSNCIISHATHYEIPDIAKNLEEYSNSSNYATSGSVLRMGESQLVEVTDRDLNFIGVQQVSPSSIYSSQNNTMATDCETAIEVAQTSYHRPALSNVEFGVIKKLPSIRRKVPSEFMSVGKNNYENIYESCVGENCMNTKLLQIHKLKSELHSSPPLPLPPRTYILRYPYNFIPRNFLTPYAFEDQSSFSSNHDYENLPPVNVNRAMLGIRHWKAYLDIEDRIHDFSTYRDKSKIDSTTLSSLQSDNSLMKGISKMRPLSIVDDGDSVLSRSLPDLSNLVLEACIQVAADAKVDNTDDEKIEALPDNSRLMTVLNTLRASHPIRSNSVDNLSNYETIWVGGVEAPEELPYSRRCADDTSGASESHHEHSSLIHTIGDVKTKGSMCNLYYSTMSDLSRRFYSETLKRNISDGSLVSQRSTREKLKKISRSTSVPSETVLEEISEGNEEQEKDNCAGDIEGNKDCASQLERDEHKNCEEFSNNRLNDPLTDLSTANQNKKKFSVMKTRFESPRWNPLKSPMKFQSPAKAIQAGIKVFTRQRVHVITPDDENKELASAKLRSPFRYRLNHNNIKSSPKINVHQTETIEVRIKQKNDNGVEQVTVRKTPLKPARPTVVSSIKNVQKTPKTSTPDNSRNRVILESSDTTKSESISTAPKHSTPEAIDRHLPQISHISGLSSVMESPELSRISSTFGISRQLSNCNGVVHLKRAPLSENLRSDRLSRVPSMAAIKETDNKYLEPTSARLNDVSKNIYSSILNSHKLDTNYNQENHRLSSEAYNIIMNLEAYKENMFFVPRNNPYNGLSQRSTLSPNSKIFQRKL